MATILLSTVGAAIGGTFGGTVLGLTGAAIGKAVGATVGGLIDQKVMGSGSGVVETGRVEEFRLQGVREGTGIPRVLGRARVAGQLIWSSNFLEKVTTTSSGGGKGVSQPKLTTRKYSYSVSVAIALGVGEITRVGRIWADGQEIAREDLKLTVYRGSEDQEPDPVIAAVEGLEKTVPFRGTAYAVFEDLDLGPYGNRIPQFNFEVFRKAQPKLTDTNDPAEDIRGVTLIPGTGEYSLATSKVEYAGDFADGAFANVNTARGEADIVESLEDLRSELPQVSSVSLVVSWFGDDLRCGSCTLRPKVEQNETDGVPMPWRVSGQDRSGASVVSQSNGRPVFGGTPADAAVLEAIAEIRAGGQKAVFYPFVLMDIQENNGLPDPYSDAPDQPAIPWRGRITLSKAPGRPGTPDKTPAAGAEVAAFFGSAQVGDFAIANGEVIYSGPAEWSYRRFILHYACLCSIAGGVEAFNLGSELRGLTQIRDGAETFPAVIELRQLAQDVRAILGPDVKIGYAADWSEYFGYHPADGSGDVFFHLDPLWAQAEIDYVGIDNYMPISDWRDNLGHADEGWGSIYQVDYLTSYVAGGEGYDWYYPTPADRDAQNRVPITDGAYGEPWVFRYKDLVGWWSNRHYNRIGGLRQQTPTSWLPKSKPFRFTEFGCPAVDKGANQPNVFFDEKSSESALPYYSDGSVDAFMQRQYFRAFFNHWSKKENNPVSDVYFAAMLDLENSHAWTWDARPWPEYPGLFEVWTDGENHARGHWLTGRFSEQPLASVVAEICEASGLEKFDVSDLVGTIVGTVVSGVETGRQSLQPLLLAYDFSAYQAEGQLNFRNREERIELTVRREDLALDAENPVVMKIRAPEAETVGRLRVNFWDAQRDYQAGSAESTLSDDDSDASSTFELPVALGSEQAKAIAGRSLVRSRVARDEIQFSLPPSVAHVTAGDVIKFEDDETNSTYRIERIEDSLVRKVEAQRMEQQVYKLKDFSSVPELSRRPQTGRGAMVRYLDLPLLRSDQTSMAPYVAATASPWPGSISVFSSVSDDGYLLNTSIETATQFGKTLNDLKRAGIGRWDDDGTVSVKLSRAGLESRSELDVLNGANVAAIGDGSASGWEIFQYRFAELQADGTYVLRGLLRGQLGTDADMPALRPAGSEVVFLDGSLVRISHGDADRGLKRNYRAGPAGQAVSSETFDTQVHAFDLIALRPLSPVHLRQTSVGGDISVSWIRRSRVDGDSWQGLDVPLGEAREQYLVRVLDGTTEVRQEIVDSPSWVYTNASIAMDGVAGSVLVEVSQVSDRFGPGATAAIQVVV